MNWHDRFKAMKKSMGWKNTDIAEITGLTHDSIKTVTQPSREFPRWLKLAVVIYETQTPMKNIAKKIREIITVNRFTVEAQHCHPERVTWEALEKAQTSAEDYFLEVTDEEIERYTRQSIDEGVDDPLRIMKFMGMENCDHSGFETISLTILPWE